LATAVPSQAAADTPDTIRLTSSELRDGEVMAQRYTCDGTDSSPPLTWEDVPDGTAELVLVLEDPDAPGGTFVHWMVADLDPGFPAKLEEGSVPEGATVGVNDFGEAEYAGPCPPHNEEMHRYVFTLMAAGVSLGLTERFTAEELRDALEGEVLAKGELIGRYGRAALTGPNPPARSG
jgi:Raf kinase inhibitor-like YbhB/YbcL family protein